MVVGCGMVLINFQAVVDYKVAAVVVHGGSTSFSFEEVLPFYISGAISQMRNISLLEIKFVVPHTSPSYSNNTLKGRRRLTLHPWYF